MLKHKKTTHKYVLRKFLKEEIEWKNAFRFKVRCSTCGYSEVRLSPLGNEKIMQSTFKKYAKKIAANIYTENPMFKMLRKKADRLGDGK